MGAVISAESRQLTDIVSTLLSWPTVIMSVHTIHVSVARRVESCSNFFLGHHRMRI